MKNGYYENEVGFNENTISKHIREQDQHEIAIDKLIIKNTKNNSKKDE